MCLTVVSGSIEMRIRGYISGDAELLASLLDQTAGSEVDPRKYHFRMFMTLRTSDDRYAEDMNFTMWIGSGMWKANELVFEYVPLYSAKLLSSPRSNLDCVLVHIVYHDWSFLTENQK
jgi:Protein of unknown function (DUF3237)